MDLVTAVWLGFVQGITEFLPISSSGHLVIAQRILGWKEPAVFFDICLHIGTFLAVLIVFRRDIVDLANGGVRFCIKRPLGENGSAHRSLDLQEKTFLLVVVGTLPTVLLGLVARRFLEGAFASTLAVSVNLLITGTFLWLTRYFRPVRPKSVTSTRGKHAFWIGLAQSLALAPGISRSGATITAGLFLGFERDWAGRFSFLLFVPAVCGALILESFHIETGEIRVIPTVLGSMAAAISGYFALRILLKVVRNGNFYLFAPYCWGMGIVCLIWSLASGS